MAEDSKYSFTVRQRSPRAPFIPLRKAIERAVEFKTANGIHAVRTASVYKAWGYAEKSSGARQTLATLIMYGLLSDIGLGEDRRVKLTDAAQRYLIDQRPDERLKILQKLAVSPEIMSTLFVEWGSEPPSDDECRSVLVFDHHFTEGAADDVLAIYKDNLEFAELTGSAIFEISDATTSEHAGSASAPTTIIGGRGMDYSLPERDTPKSVDVWIRGPLSAETSYQIYVDGSMGPKEIGKLIKILEAQKAVLSDDD